MGRREPAGNSPRVSRFSTEQHEGDVSASQTYPNAGVLPLIPLPQKARGLLYPPCLICPKYDSFPASLSSLHS